MFCEVYINDQHLHTYSASLMEVHDCSSVIKFELLEKKYEYRKNLAAGFIEMVEYQLQINKIKNYQLYLLFPSQMKNRTKLL